MTIKAIYRDGVFAPLEPVNLQEDSLVSVDLQGAATSKLRAEGSLFEVLGTRDLCMPPEDFKDLPPGFEEYAT